MSKLVEITYYPSGFPKITSYYALTDDQFASFKLAYDGLYLENFMGNEPLTRANCDFHVYENPENIRFLTQFLEVYENPCDLLGRFSELAGPEVQAALALGRDEDSIEYSDDAIQSISSITQLLSEANKKDRDIVLMRNIVAADAKVLVDEDVQHVMAALDSSSTAS